MFDGKKVHRKAESHTCQNGASCVDSIRNYSCKCPTGYTGGYCETGRVFCFLLVAVVLFTFIFIVL